jgi:hypothetical protein
LHVIVQLPPLHPGVPFAPPQKTLQPPQLLGSALVGSSQPFAGLPSQSLKPGLQVGVHTPAEHATWPFGFRHLFPQPPQSFGLVATSSSQPLFGSPSQSAQPVLQVGWHCPATQLVEPLAFVQAVSQSPQLATLPVRFASQPFAGSPSQSSKPGLQEAITHEPPAQAATAFDSTHALLHAPQCAGLPSRFVSQPLLGSLSQSPWSGAHCESSQVPALQTGDPPTTEHTFEHVPQLFLSLRTSISQPSAGSRLQSTNQVVLHVPISHCPETQIGIAFGTTQALPQPPQWLVLDAVSISQPSVGSPLQSSYPGMHWSMTQAAFTQAAIAPGIQHGWQVGSPQPRLGSVSSGTQPPSPPSSCPASPPSSCAASPSISASASSKASTPASASASGFGPESGATLASASA